ncbi:hypothetical protein [Roseomonas elaeocarpi]|uniref:Amidohydrolase-related domain-containing protein n=1 Tax=Roseomonas elaeocarpi TaxID=907779 RepID=A0ABV6JLP0_9PROT
MLMVMTRRTGRSGATWASVHRPEVGLEVGTEADLLMLSTQPYVLLRSLQELWRVPVPAFHQPDMMDHGTEPAALRAAIAGQLWENDWEEAAVLARRAACISFLHSACTRGRHRAKPC